MLTIISFSIFLLFIFYLFKIFVDLFFFYFFQHMEKPYFFVTFFLLLSFSVYAQRCRFAKYYTQDQVKADPEPFLKEFIQWEAKFIRSVGVHQLTGITYDGYRLDLNTGDLLSGGLRSWTASSK